MTDRLAATIRRLRKNCGLTQKELAARVGVTAQAVSKWERGDACPDIFLLPTLASIFGVSIDEIMGYGGRNK